MQVPDILYTSPLFAGFKQEEIQAALYCLKAKSRTVEEAAMLAAYFSRGQQSSQVPVDCTQVRYVKKPAGAAPGMVIYTDYETFYVTPDADVVDRLTGKKQ